MVTVYVKNPFLVDLDKLPTQDELYEIYGSDPLIPCVDYIIRGYKRKIDLLEPMQACKKNVS